MALIQKTLFGENLDRYNTFVQDTDTNSKYFKITELPDTFTGGKNAFLIQGSEYLVADTLIKIELKDSSGNIIYHEPGEGYFSSSLNDESGKAIITEYYEGVSKVVAVYVYPETAFGPCTLTILGELSEYDNNGLLTPIPVNWQGQYNVKWQKQINVNPSLSNTTKIRFYQRPVVTINEIISPIFRIENGVKINSGINQSFANIKLSKLETFAGDVKRVKVFRTSQGDISDFDLIQDILVESKELLTTTELSGSVVGNTGIFTSETLKNFWNTGSLNTELTSSRIESGVKLTGNGNFRYTSSLDIKSANTYELNCLFPTAKIKSYKIMENYLISKITLEANNETFELVHYIENVFDKLSNLENILNINSLYTSPIDDLTIICDRKLWSELYFPLMRHHKDIFEKSIDSVMVLKNGLFLDCNEATLKMFGYNDKESVLKLHPSQISPEFQSDGSNSFIKAEKFIGITIENGFNRFRWEHQRKNGQVFQDYLWHHGGPFRDLQAEQGRTGNRGQGTRTFKDAGSGSPGRPDRDQSSLWGSEAG